MPIFKLTIAYDGTGFVGWQRQATGTSIQGLLEDALSDLDGRAVTVIGAGRTDAGVHALGQVAGVSIDRVLDSGSLVRAVNARLPPAVRVTAAVEAPPGFHARFQARSKTYRYRIWNADVLSPFHRPYVWHVPGARLNVDAMSEAARLLEGRHDFAAFQAAGTETHGTERVVLSSTMVAAGADSTLAPCDTVRSGVDGRSELVIYEIRGTGFLRHMVRAIIGTLVEVGRARRPPDWIAEVLASRERGRAGPTAPAEGLFLMSVDYE